MRTGEWVSEVLPTRVLEKENKKKKRTKKKQRRIGSTIARWLEKCSDWFTPLPEFHSLIECWVFCAPFLDTRTWIWAALGEKRMIQGSDFGVLGRSVEYSGRDRSKACPPHDFQWHSMKLFRIRTMLQSWFKSWWYAMLWAEHLTFPPFDDEEIWASSWRTLLHCPLHPDPATLLISGTAQVGSHLSLSKMHEWSTVLRTIHYSSQSRGENPQSGGQYSSNFTWGVKAQDLSMTPTCQKVSYSG